MYGSLQWSLDHGIELFPLLYYLDRFLFAVGAVIVFLECFCWLYSLDRRPRDAASSFDAIVVETARREEDHVG